MYEYAGQEYVGDDGYSDAEVGDGGYEVGAFPWVDMVSGDGGYDVGACPVGAYPWLDMVSGDGDAEVGAYPWVDMVLPPWVGATDDASRRRAWPRTRALIQSAIREVTDLQGAYPRDEGRWPTEAYVWSLETYGGGSPRPGVTLGPTTQIIPFASREQALAHMRDRIQTEHIALALFDKSSPHWPNPVNWTKRDDPSYEPMIAQQIARYAPTRASGEIGELVGMGPWYTIIGATIDMLRNQAKAAAEEMPGRSIGTIRDNKGSWQIKAFRTLDDADDWFGHAIAEPGAFTYAAYFEKERGIPYLENEAIGGARSRTPSRPQIPRAIATVTVKP